MGMQRERERENELTFQKMGGRYKNERKCEIPQQRKEIGEKSRGMFCVNCAQLWYTIPS